MKSYIKIIIFFIISFISYRFNYNLDKPRDPGAHHLLILHHILAIYISIGWILLPRKYLHLYLYLTIASLFHWKFNNNKCVLTDAYYYIIGKIDYKNKENRISMRDFYWLLGIKDSTCRDFLYRLLITCGCVYCFYYKIY